MSIHQKGLFSLLSLWQKVSRSVEIWQSSDEKCLHSFFETRCIFIHCYYVQGGPKNRTFFGIPYFAVGSGRRRSVRTAANIRNIEDLICSQEGQPDTSKSPRDISRETVISRSSVQRIAKRDLKMMFAAVRTERRRPLPVNLSVVPVWSFSSY